MTRWPLVALAAALALAAGETRAINKCVDKTGKVTYQEGRCPDEARENEFKPMPGPKPDANAAAAKGTETPEQEEAAITQLVSVQLGYEGCTASDPNFAEQHAAQYEAWRTVNAPLITRYENTQSYRTTLARGRQELKENPKQGRESQRFCGAQLVHMLGTNTPR